MGRLWLQYLRAGQAIWLGPGLGNPRGSLPSTAAPQGTWLYPFIEGDYLVLVEPSPTVMNRATVRFVVALFYCEMEPDTTYPTRFWLLARTTAWVPTQILFLIFPSAELAAAMQTDLAKAKSAVWGRKMRAVWQLLGLYPGAEGA